MSKLRRRLHIIEGEIQLEEINMRFTLARRIYKGYYKSKVHLDKNVILDIKTAGRTTKSSSKNFAKEIAERFEYVIGLGNFPRRNTFLPREILFPQSQHHVYLMPCIICVY